MVRVKNLILAVIDWGNNGPHRGITLWNAIWDRVICCVWTVALKAW